MHDGHEDDIAAREGVVVRKRRKGIYILPNLFTLAALFGGFYAIVMAMNGRFDLAAIGVFCAMVLDSLDGRVARMTNTQSAFGEQMDSLSDMVSLRRRAGADRLRMGAQGPGPLGLDRRLRLLRLRGAAAGALQRQHRRGRQALLPGPASPAAAALVTGFIWLMTELRRQAGDDVLPGSTFAVALYAGLTMVTNVPFYSFKDVQMKKSVPVRRDRADRAGHRRHQHPSADACCSRSSSSTACRATSSMSGARPKGQPASVISTSTDEPEEQRPAPTEIADAESRRKLVLHSPA